MGDDLKEWITYFANRLGKISYTVGGVENKQHFLKCKGYSLAEELQSKIREQIIQMNKNNGSNTLGDPFKVPLQPRATLDPRWRVQSEQKKQIKAQAKVEKYEAANVDVDLTDNVDMHVDLGLEGFD